MAIKFNPNKYSTASVLDDHFSDFKTNMDVHPATGDLLRVRNEAAVVQSLRNLLLTNFYERPFQPYIGSRLQENLFEDLSMFTALNIKQAIKDTIANYESRVDLLETIVEPNAAEDGYDIRLRIAIINSIEPIDVDFFLNRVR